MRKLATVLVTAVLVLATAAPSHAAKAGSRDKTFSGNGEATVGFGGYGSATGRDVLVTSSGKVVMAAALRSGSKAVFGVARLKKNGNPDTSFSGDGRRTTGFSAAAEPRRVIALGKGRILVGGSAGDAFGLAAFRSDGSPATTFGGDGKVTTDVSPGPDLVLDLRRLSNGKVLAAGFAGDEFAVVRYLPNGTPDDTFGTDGVVLTTDGFDGTAYDVGLQADGKLLAVGETQPFEGIALSRFDTDGSLDDTFGGGTGRVETIPGDDVERAAANTVVVQPDGRILVGGYTFVGDSTRFALARYLEDGTPDGTFGGGGLVQHQVQPFFAQISALALQSDRKIVAAGWTDLQSPVQDALAVTRYRPNGRLDKTFSGNGQTYLSYGERKRAQAYGVAVRGKRIVAVGEVANSAGNKPKATVVALTK